MDEAPTQERQARLASYHQSRKARRRAAGLDEAYNSRLLARALVDDAAAVTDLRADLSARSNVVRLMLAMYRANGSLNWRRGWADRMREVLGERGLPVPSGKVLRWYRSNLSANPMMFSRCPQVDVATLEAIEARYLRA